VGARWQKGQSIINQHFAYGLGHYGGEPIFALADDGVKEDDGWIIGYVWDDNEKRSECRS
jgi:carotenoid cleavage dioxygenase-like enzyme